MARPVAMEILANSSADAKARFVALAQAKAAVKHPAIVSVYEAGEADGQVFYTSEYVDGRNLAEMRARNENLDDKLALTIAKAVAEGMLYLQQHSIPCAPLEARRIFLDKNQEAHLGNLAVLPGEGNTDFAKDAATMGNAITALLPGGIPADARMIQLFNRLQSDAASGGFASWSALLSALRELAPKVIPADAVKITAQEQAAIRAVEKMKQQQRRSMIYAMASTVVGFLLVALFIYYKFFFTNERKLDQMVEIPAGEFIFQNGQKEATGAFWIDKYEVTLGQYGRFLADLKAHPEKAKDYDSPDQPKAKTGHIPGNQENIWNVWYGRARVGKTARYVRMDLNCPIFNVDYWDAYAYAKWAGKRLPTEKEWEKAARGAQGFLYPWGNEFDPKKANLGKDYLERLYENDKGAVDGYAWWNPVDKMKGDTSPYGVVGMLGNTAEWTSTWDSDTRGPIIRGGSFHKEEANLLFRADRKSVRPPPGPNDCFDFVGFRCVSDVPPQELQKKK